MPNILSIGKTGLMAANVGISVTGHNITNASTPGYNRQVVVQSNMPGQRYGFGFVGNGTNVDDVRRIYNSFLGTQALSAQSSKSSLETYYTQIKQINNKLADSTVGISPSLQNFFSSVQELSTTPNSAAVRQTLLSDSEMMAGRFNSMAEQLVELRGNLNSQVSDTVNLINTYSVQIAELNEAINRSQVISSNPAPNDLLDQRDLLIAELSKQINVSVVNNGLSLDVYVGNGQPLVINNANFTMFSRTENGNPNQLQIGFTSNGNQVIIPEQSLTGGALGGLMQFRKQTLDTVENELGRLAITLATDFNTQHKLGMDLNGDPGGDFFNVPLTASTFNAGGGSVTSTIQDPSQLTTSDYRVTVGAAGPSLYTLTRLNDGAQFTSSDGINFNPVPAGPAVTTIDGIQFSFAGTLNQGDNLVIRPVALGAAGLQVAITDTNKIAAASPLRTAIATANTGSMAVSLGQVTTLPLPAPTTWTFSNNVAAPTQRLTVVPATSVNVTVNGVTTNYPTGVVPYTEGATYEYGGFEFTATGIPGQGDSFKVEANTGGVSDNRNMLLLAGLQDAKTMLGGTTTYQGAYSRLVNSVGNKTRELEITSKAAATLLSGIQEQQQAESGVNLDEEAVKLLQYQQAYQASAKIIKAASDMFDILASLGR